MMCVGLDVHQKWTTVVALDAGTAEIRRFHRVTNEPEAFRRTLGQLEGPLHGVMVAGVSERSRKLLQRRRGLNAAGRQRLNAQLNSALEHFTRGAYAECILVLHRVASAALESAAVSDQYRSLLAAQYGEDVSQLTPREKVRLLLESNEHLETNVGFLAGLRHDSRRHPPRLEEALLAVFAFRQVVQQLGRPRWPPSGE